MVDDRRRIAASRRNDECLFCLIVRGKRSGLRPDFARDGVQDAAMCLTGFSSAREATNEREQTSMEHRQVTFIVQLHGRFEAATEATDHVLEPGDSRSSARRYLAASGAIRDREGFPARSPVQGEPV